ncbi:MAG TPA: HEAT repeat domain-containing protein [Bryobacteraceae bacterium]|nr:HEAT repeat domain-containing protein [Bryobacteraceae bacterium]
MSCEEIRALLVLYPYGELSFDEEEAVDAHLRLCAGCEQERGALAKLHSAFGEAESEPSLELLSACRRDLRKQVAVMAEASGSRPFWRKWLPRFDWHWAAKPAMGMALFAAGFVGARYLPAAGTGVAGNPAAKNVRFIEAAEGGGVRIVYDEVRQKEMSGRVDDQRVREMLLAATRDPNDPALRVDSVEFLKNRGEREEVRTAFVRALTSDPNEGVRLKALEALKPYAGESDVRSALTKVLMADQSATVRTQTIDLLVNTRHDEGELAGVLQDLMRREQNSYIRQRSQTALRAMNASLETF